MIEQIDNGFNITIATKETRSILNITQIRTVISNIRETLFRCIYQGDAGSQSVDHKVYIIPPQNETRVCHPEFNNGRFWPETAVGTTIYVTCPPNTIG